jgi:hypothetical protein
MMVAINVFFLFAFFFFQELFCFMLVDGPNMSFLCAGLKYVCGSGVIAPRTLDLRPRLGDKPHKPATVPLGKSRWYPWNRTLDGFQNRSGCFGDEKNISSLVVIVQPRHYTN